MTHPQQTTREVLEHKHGERRTLWECTGCGHLHSEKVSSCDCGENPAATYNEWVAHPTPSTTGEADEYQYRTKPTWDANAPWSDWTKCNRGSFEDYKRTPVHNDWIYEARALFATTPPQVEPAPSTAGERDNKTEMLAKLTAWLDSLGGKLHTYSLRGIALAGFEEGWSAALMQSTADHIAQNRKLVAALPVGELPEPFHPRASHINPDYRDGWNAALAAASSQPVREPLTDYSDTATIAGLESSVGHLSVMVDELRLMLGDAMNAMTELHSKVTPDEDTPNIDGIVPAAAYAKFVNAHADLLYRIHHSPHAGQLSRLPAAHGITKKGGES